MSNAHGTEQHSPDNHEHPHHGNTPAAWVAVIVGLAAFLVGGIGLMIGSMVTFWVGVALAPIALIVGALMGRMGYGMPR